MPYIRWIATVSEPAECPDFKATENPYTGEVTWPSSHCLVVHYRTVTKRMEAEFDTRENAEAFIRKAPKNCSDFSIDGKPFTP